MKQPVPASFIAYVKYMLEKSPISVRELNRKIDKSSAYMTKLLGGQIGSIEFTTACQIIKTLAPNMPDIELFLIDHFGIKPDELIRQDIENAELRYEQRLEEVKEGQEIVDNISKSLMEELITGGGIEKIEFIKELSELDLHLLSDDRMIIQGILWLKKHPKEYRLVGVFISKLLSMTGEIMGEYIHLSDKESEIMTNIQNIIEEDLKNERS